MDASVYTYYDKEVKQWLLYFYKTKIDTIWNNDDQLDWFVKLNKYISDIRETSQYEQKHEKNEIFYRETGE